MRAVNTIAATDEGERSYTIPEFCALENISPFTYHKMKRLGLGPVELRVPGLSIVRITRQSRLEWHKRMEALQQKEGAR